MLRNHIKPNNYSRHSNEREEIDQPSRIFVDFNVHPGSDPYEMQLSHRESCCKPICWKPNTLSMVASNLLHYKLFHEFTSRNEIQNKIRMPYNFLWDNNKWKTITYFWNKYLVSCLRLGINNPYAHGAQRFFKSLKYLNACSLEKIEFSWLYALLKIKLKLEIQKERPFQIFIAMKAHQYNLKCCH